MRRFAGEGEYSCCAGLRTGSVLSSAQPGVKRKNRISRDRAFRVSAGDCGAAVLFSPEKPDHQRTFPAYGRGAGRKPQWCADHGRTGGRQGRDVGAVPGNIDSEYNLGSNKLLREGAFALTGVQDLLDASGVSVLSEPEAERMLSDEEKQLYFLLCSHGEMSLDQLAFYLKKP